MNTNDINVIIEGGLVQHVVSTNKALMGKTVNIIDYDVDGANDDEISIVCGHEAIVTAFIVGAACDDFSIETN